MARLFFFFDSIHLLILFFVSSPFFLRISRLPFHSTGSLVLSWSQRESIRHVSPTGVIPLCRTVHPFPHDGSHVSSHCIYNHHRCFYYYYFLFCIFFLYFLLYPCSLYFLEKSVTAHNTPFWFFLWLQKGVQKLQVPKGRSSALEHRGGWRFLGSRRTRRTCFLDGNGDGISKRCRTRRCRCTASGTVQESCTGSSGSSRCSYASSETFAER